MLSAPCGDTRGRGARARRAHGHLDDPAPGRVAAPLPLAAAKEPKRGWSMVMNLQARNADLFRTAEAAERYSVYRLTPNEKSLVGRYYQAGESVLDLACGAARTTLRLHELGMRVKGVDI